MRIRSVAHVVGAAAAIAVLVACSGAGSQLAPEQTSILQEGRFAAYRRWRSSPRGTRGTHFAGCIPPASNGNGCNLRQHPLHCRNVYVSTFSSSSIACYNNTDKNGTLYSSASAGLINPQGETQRTWGPPDQQLTVLCS